MAAAFLIVIRKPRSRLVKGSAVEDVRGLGDVISIKFEQLEAVGVVRSVYARRNGQSCIAVREGTDTLDTSRVYLRRAGII